MASGRLDIKITADGRDVRRDRKLELLLDTAIAELPDRTDLAITNLVHAIFVAYGIPSVSSPVRRRLNEIMEKGGGYR